MGTVGWAAQRPGPRPQLRKETWPLSMGGKRPHLACQRLNTAGSLLRMMESRYWNMKHRCCVCVCVGGGGEDNPRACDGDPESREAWGEEDSDCVSIIVLGPSLTEEMTSTQLPRLRLCPGQCLV